MRINRAQMVEWFSPTLLLKAAVEVVVSKLFGQHADQRTVQSLLATAKVYDYTSGTRVEVDLHNGFPETLALGNAGGNEGQTWEHNIWVDYVSDVGDGWNSTYSVAWLLSQPQLELREHSESQHHMTERGRLLIFGGDEVYPIASRDEYDRRLLAPYREAYSAIAPDKPVDVFAIPGNHDWYDSLRSFSRIFFTSTPFADIPNSSTPQSRSYFAIKLGFGWWILGTDVQLGSDIDASQYEYFQFVSKQFSPEDRVILCTAEPHWLRCKRSQKDEAITGETALDRLERELLGNRVSLFIAGDVHHYMRFQSQSSVHKITAGGGGAFLHPTHRSWEKKLIVPSHDQRSTEKSEFHRAPNAIFPPVRVSWLLSLRNWLFVYMNPRFGIFTGMLYVILTLVMLPAFDEYNKRRSQERTEKVLADYRRLVDEMRANFDRVKSTAANTPSLSSEISDLAMDITELPIGQDIRQGLRTINWPAEKRLLEKWRKELDQSRVAAESDQANGTDTTQRELVEKAINSIDNVQQVVSKLDLTVLNAKKSGYFDRAMVASGRVKNPPVVENTNSMESRNVELPSDDASDQSRIPAPPKLEVERMPGPLYFLYELTKQELKLPRPFESLLAILVFVGVFGGFIAFTAIPQLPGRILLGMTHGMAHWLAAYLLTYTLGIGAAFQSMAPEWIFVIILILSLAITTRLAATGEYGLNLTRLATAVPGATVFSAVIYFSIVNDLPSLTVVLIVFLGGWIIGSTIMGGYLFLTHSVTGQHWNEAFSSIHCEDWKCFVRFKISPTGELTIYPVGIPKVSRKWREDVNGIVPLEELCPILIEKPLTIPVKSVVEK